MDFTLYLKWVLDNIDKIPQLIVELKDVWDGETLAEMTKELAEFLAKLADVLVTFPDPAAVQSLTVDDMNNVEATALEAAAFNQVSLRDLILLYNFIREILRFLDRR